MPYLLPFTHSSLTWWVRTAREEKYVNFSSAFNTVWPWSWLENVTFWWTRCNRILDFLTNRQGVWIGSVTFSTLVLNTGGPQGCVFTPHLFTLYPHDCTPRHQDSSVVKYVHYTTITNHIINNTESSPTALSFITSSMHRQGCLKMTINLACTLYLY